MSEFWYTFISIDLPPLLTAIFATSSCALLGNFLLLRKASLMGDAISHSVLPGIVVAFLITNSRSTVAVLVGASIAGVLTAILIELIKRFGKVESGAAMGVVFSLLFALGVLLIEQAAARNVDLDAECLLHGQLESIFWLPPDNFRALLSWSVLSELPSELASTFFIALLSFCFVFLLFKELTVSSFDPLLSTTLGINANCLHIALMIFVGFAVVASFEAVGSILVIAMLIAPAATARLLTDRLRAQIGLSLLFGIIASVGGYILATLLPNLLGWNSSVNAAGMMAVTSGIALAVVALLSPTYGLLGRSLRSRGLRSSMSREDLLSLLYRSDELDWAVERTQREVYKLKYVIGERQYVKAINALAKEQLLIPNEFKLTEEGRRIAEHTIRKHRLWESYLVEKMGLRKDHVHELAHALEHVTSEEMESELEGALESKGKIDPHGRRIP